MIPYSYHHFDIYTLRFLALLPCLFLVNLLSQISAATVCNFNSRIGVRIPTYVRNLASPLCTTLSDHLQHEDYFEGLRNAELRNPKVRQTLLHEILNSAQGQD